MKDGVYTVLDAAAGAYMEPFFSATTETAIRGFREVCSRDNHPFKKFPEDFFLYKIGNFDKNTGFLEAHEPQKIAGALEFRAQGPEVVS